MEQAFLLSLFVCFMDLFWNQMSLARVHSEISSRFAQVLVGLKLLLQFRELFGEISAACLLPAKKTM